MTELPKAHGGCTCLCHRKEGVHHFFPCCGPGAITPEWIKKMAEKEGDHEISAGSHNHPLRKGLP